MAPTNQSCLAEYEWAPNGLNKFTVAIRENENFLPLPPNTEMFTSLAVAINIGIEMLETRSGRHALAKLGHKIVEARTVQTPPVPFYGDITMMDTYVDHFLSRVRSDLPRFVVEDQPSLDELAYTNKGDWEGGLGDFKPKQAGSVTFNMARVKSMVRSHEKYSALRGGSSSQWRPYLDRWQGFLFMFACATAHEFAHLFVCYLSLGKDVHTPPRVVHLNYNQAVVVRGQRVVVGESGRWLEAALFGGSLEYFRDVNQGPDQASEVTLNVKPQDGPCIHFGFPYCGIRSAINHNQAFRGEPPLLYFPVRGVPKWAEQSASLANGPAKYGEHGSDEANPNHIT